MWNNSLKYQRENYQKYWWNKKAIADRTARNWARAKMVKAGKVKKGDGKEVDHKKGIAWWNGNGNLRVLSQKKNRQLWAAKANRNKAKKK